MAVIGAGMSGLLAAHRLHQAGVHVVVFEKNADVGGTWWENTYPNCRVDVPSHLYTYSCAAEVDWTEHFAPQPEIHAAFRAFARATGVEKLVRFGCEVREMAWDGTAWQLTLGDGATFTAQVVVNAVGQLNRPSIPDIPGRDTFAGAAFHTAGWDHDAEIAGRQVAVIGTGASGMQVVPPLAARAGRLTIVQRSPAWPVPTPALLAEVDPRLRWLFATIPGYQRWYRFWLLRRVSDALLPFATVDPEWHSSRSVSHLNDRVRVVAQAYLELEFAGRPDLLAKVVPSHPPFSKRSVRDDGAWARALTRGRGAARSWYTSTSGRVSQNWPGTVLEYWQLPRTADPAAYPLAPFASASSHARIAI